MNTNLLESDKNNSDYYVKLHKLKSLLELAIIYEKCRVILLEQFVQEGILTADVHRALDAAVNDVGDAVDFAGAVDVPEE